MKKVLAVTILAAAITGLVGLASLSKGIEPKIYTDSLFAVMSDRTIH